MQEMAIKYTKPTYTEYNLKGDKASWKDDPENGVKITFVNLRKVL
jgi:hypothetical protein